MAIPAHPNDAVAHIDDRTRLLLLTDALRDAGHVPAWWEIGRSQIIVVCHRCNVRFHVAREHASDSPSALNLDSKNPCPLNRCSKAGG